MVEVFCVGYECIFLEGVWVVADMITGLLGGVGIWSAEKHVSVIGYDSFP